MLLTGCAREPDVKQQSLQNRDIVKLSSDGTARSLAVNQSAAEAAVERVRGKHEIREAVAVSTSDKLLLAYQVKQMHRFRKQQIERNILKQLRSLFPKHQIIVSGDLKLFWKTNELRQRLEKDDMNERELNREIAKLKKLSEEQA